MTHDRYRNRPGPRPRPVVKRLGDWTTARRFDVRASRGLVVLDLLLPRSSPARSRSRSTSTTPPSSCSSPTAPTSTTTTCAASAAAGSRTGPARRPPAVAGSSSSARCATPRCGYTAAASRLYAARRSETDDRYAKPVARDVSIRPRP